MSYERCEWGNKRHEVPCKKKARVAVEVPDLFNHWSDGGPVKVCKEHADFMHSPMRVVVTSWPL